MNFYCHVPKKSLKKCDDNFITISGKRFRTFIYTNYIGNKMETFGNQKSQKVAHKYLCKKCDYKCNRKNDFTKHLSTDKHNGNILETFGNQKSQKVATVFYCICGKGYKDRSGLWKHKKNCVATLHDKIMNNDNADIVCELVKQNKELKELLIEQNNKILEVVKEGKIINTTNNTNNTMNNHFNLNFFLNEKCKDAVNIQDFVNSLQIQLNDLEETGRIGYINGITKIFVKGLQEMDICKRPIHCSDLKREILYVKDKDKWEKDNGNEKLKNAIRVVSNKNAQQVYKWGMNNPEYMNGDSKKNDEYLKLINITMGGSTTEEEYKNLEKIAKNVVKEVCIDK
jgi:hypothetical protein